jgi:type II secretory pathway pseudopilin PulG
MNFTALTTKQVPTRRQPRGLRGFTMIEIAISIGVIGFALVAIIGILPAGMNVQKDNREDTVINQDANFFMQAIRNGAILTNDPQYGPIPYAPSLNFLTNYVEGIVVSNVSANSYTYYYTNFPGDGQSRYFPFGGGIVGLLSTPHFLVNDITTALTPNAFNSTNYVRAWVRGLNGSALEQNGANAAVAFRYVMDVQISPFVSFPLNVITAIPGDPSSSRQAAAQYLCHNLYDAELTFHWPILANGALGPNHQTFRSLIAGHMATPNLASPIYYVFQPQTYATNTLQ